MKTGKIGILVAVLLICGLGSVAFGDIVVGDLTTGTDVKQWMSYFDRSTYFDPGRFGQTFTTPGIAVTVPEFKCVIKAGVWSVSVADFRLDLYDGTNRTVNYGSVTLKNVPLTISTEKILTFDLTGLSNLPEGGFPPRSVLYAEVHGPNSLNAGGSGDALGYAVIYNSGNAGSTYDYGIAYQSVKDISTNPAPTFVYNANSDLNFEATFVGAVVVGNLDGIDSTSSSYWLSFTDRAPAALDPIGVGQTFTAPGVSGEGVTFETLTFEWAPGGAWPFDGAEWEVQVYASTNKTTLLGEVTNAYTALAKTQQTTEFDFGAGISVTPGQGLYFEIKGAANVGGAGGSVAYSVYGNNTGYIDGNAYKTNLSGTPTLDGTTGRDLNFEALFGVVVLPKGTMAIIQ